jgi:hypothetical protein
MGYSFSVCYVPPSPSIPSTKQRTLFYAVLAALLLVASLAPSGALAESATRTGEDRSAIRAGALVDLSYEVPLGCPPKQDFQRALGARTPEVRWGGPDAPRQLGVAITQGPSGFRGSLTVSANQEPPVQRTLENPACAALVDALALVASVDLEFALTRRIHGVEAPPTAARGDGQAHQSTERPIPGPRASPSRAATWSRNRRDRGEPSRRAPRGFEQLVAAVGGMQTAPTPTLLPTGGLHWGIRLGRRGPHFGVSAHYGQTGLRRYDRGDVRFRWAAARFFGCPLGAERVPFALFACANAEVGLLRAEPERTLEPTVRNGVWFAPGLGMLGSVWTQVIAAEAFVGLTRPVVRDEFFFASASPSDDKERVHQAPALGPIAELRLGVPF